MNYGDIYGTMWIFPSKEIGVAFENGWREGNTVARYDY